MQGLELAKAYYESCGAPMIREQFPHLMPYLAAGLMGSGSECFGYDDAVSRDHDFEPGFCLFLPDEETVGRRDAFLLERAYQKLPDEFMGVSRARIAPAGGPRHGVLRISDFFREKTGFPDGRLTLSAWLSVPEYALAEAVNGEIFFDGYGEITGIRDRLAFYPEDIRRKKLAGNLVLMEQSGRYNYRRCLLHNEKAAAQLAAAEFVRSAISAVFLLNKVYQPYYKWTFRAMRSLPSLSLLAELLEYLLTTDNEPSVASDKEEVMAGIASDIIQETGKQILNQASWQDPEKTAWLVNDTITDPGLRNMHILSGV